MRMHLIYRLQLLNYKIKWYPKCTSVTTWELEAPSCEGMFWRRDWHASIFGFDFQRFTISAQIFCKSVLVTEPETYGWFCSRGSVKHYPYIIQVRNFVCSRQLRIQAQNTVTYIHFLKELFWRFSKCIFYEKPKPSKSKNWSR